jgi:hypothetical protein
MHILTSELKRKKAILLFDGWNPVAEGRPDTKPFLGEVWIEVAPYGYDCVIVWYKKYWIFKIVQGREVFFRGRKGGALKSLIRGTNLYFNRNDDVDGGVNITEIDEW